MISRPSESRLLTEPAVFLPGLFNCLLNFRTILLQQFRRSGFEPKDQHGLRIGGADQSPALGEQDADAVDIDGGIETAELLGNTLDDVELYFVGAIDADLGRCDGLG